MSKVSEAFRNGKALVVFVTCGDPDLETTADVVRSLAANGADLIELGIPFSDPTAEGPVIQGANLRSLKAGTTTDKVFDMVETLDVDVPLAFMTYANVVFSYGTDRFLDRCEKTGVSALILPDVPYEEKEDFEPACARHGIDLISMVAPTSHERISMIARGSKGFLYVVSSLGVTGTRSRITTDIGPMIESIRRSTDTPCAVGFGISSPEQAKEMSEKADGVIIGSAVVKIIAKHGRDSAIPVGEFVKAVKDRMSGS